MTIDELIYAYFRNDRAANAAKRSGNLSFAGDLLYSYSTIIGRLTRDAFYCTNKKYSKTTSAHVNKAIRQAHIAVGRVEIVDPEQLSVRPV